MRYAANHAVAAARERFRGRSIIEADAGLWLVQLRGRPSAMHLTHQANLDALGLDERISSGRLDRPTTSGRDPLLATGQALSDAVFDWYDGQPPPLVYRTRSLPVRRSMAFTRSVDLQAVNARPLREALGLLTDLVLRHGFTVPGHWLE